ncbi:uncharacterized protein LOC129742397 [Uranotaenia lowii]|uniref:uncharacterized protein LOC129742397 n=1 Tax=Uranotaenia lowii TaxID=190385 RepID=UPI002479D220|nr:uncharacterized protein LOC129742397 [Uranotaenia lowii]
MEIDQTENLINCVFAKRPLWDKTTKFYRNRIEIEKLWRTVATELGGDTTSDSAKKKWKNLRDTFSKELRKIPESRSGDASRLNFEAYTTWPCFESMVFLRHQLKPRKSGGNLSRASGESSNPVDGDDVEFMEESLDESVPYPEASGSSKHTVRNEERIAASRY